MHPKLKTALWALFAVAIYAVARESWPARSDISTGKVSKSVMRRAAYHEAGHAILYAAYFDPAGLKEANVCTITPCKDGELGAVALWHAPNMLAHIDMLRYSAYRLAGQIANELRTGGATSAARADIKEANALIWKVHAQYGMGPTYRFYEVGAATPLDIEAAIDHDIADVALCVRIILKANAATHDALVARLMRAPPMDGRRTLGQRQLVAFFRSHPIRIPDHPDLPWFCAPTLYTTPL